MLHEIQLNRWLYSYVSSCLSKLEYVVERRHNNVRGIRKGFLPEEVNEYATLRGDLVIYKCTGLQVKGCLVQLVCAEADVEHMECLSGLVRLMTPAILPYGSVFITCLPLGPH